MQYLNHYLSQITTLCHQYNGRKLFAFGSVLIDNYFDFEYSLEDVFGRDVDLLEEQSIRNSYLRKSIENTKTLIYG
jgi:predicted nucleotidyltransferase